MGGTGKTTYPVPHRRTWLEVQFMRARRQGKSHSAARDSLQRLADIVAAVARGEPYAAIAERHGVSRQRIHQLYREQARARATDPTYRDPRLLALLLELPPAGAAWPRAARSAWLARMGAVIDAIFGAAEEV